MDYPGTEEPGASRHQHALADQIEHDRYVRTVRWRPRASAWPA
jgi:hypothetical protein